MGLLDFLKRKKEDDNSEQTVFSEAQIKTKQKDIKNENYHSDNKETEISWDTLSFSSVGKVDNNGKTNSKKNIDSSRPALDESFSSHIHVRPNYTDPLSTQKKKDLDPQQGNTSSCAKHDYSEATHLKDISQGNNKKPQLFSNDYTEYTFPTTELLPISKSKNEDEIPYEEFLQAVFDNYNINAKIVSINQNNFSVTFGIAPGRGVRVNSITSYKDEFEKALRGRVEYEIPLKGTTYLGLHLLKDNSENMTLRKVLESEIYVNSTAKVPLLLGVSMSGEPFIEDLDLLGHLLIVGQTGSGKSVLINSLILGMLYKKSPADLRFVFIDPSRLNLGLYEGIPHNICPVITDPQVGVSVLSWCLDEINRRTEILAENRFRDIDDYNEKYPLKKLPHIVVIVDECNPLIESDDDINLISSITMSGKALGVHLILATQYLPNRKALKTVKSCIHSRIAFAVSSEAESKAILDVSGAEYLLGSGDMIFIKPGKRMLTRIQGISITDEDTNKTVQFIKENNKQYPVLYPIALIDLAFSRGFSTFLNGNDRSDNRFLQDDPLYEEVVDYVIDVQKASTSLLQRRFGIRYDRAAKMIDLLEERGIISPAHGSVPREVYVKRQNDYRK